MKYAPSLRQIIMGVGDPIAHSLSPAMHNAAYEELEIEDEFIYLNSQVGKGNLSGVIAGMRSMNFRGLTCTRPHKVDAINHLDEIDGAAKQIGAVNTIVNDAGILRGYNTDWIGIVEALEEKVSLQSKRMAIVGAGGTARAATYGAKRKGALPVIFNRSSERGEKLAQDMECEFRPLKEIEELVTFDVIVNTTNVGMPPDADRSLVPSRCLRENQVVMDVIYSPYRTKLIEEAEEAGAQSVHGLSMFLHQAAPQFELYTGKIAPRERMAKVLCEHFGLRSL